MSKKAFTVRTVIILYMIFVIGTSLGVYSIISNRTLQRQLLDKVDDKLLTAAVMANEILGSEYHDGINSSDSVSEKEYLSIVQRWDSLCLSLNLEYIWSLMSIEDRIVFTSGSSADKKTETADFAAFFEEHTNQDAYKHVFSGSAPEYIDLEDRWGNLRAVLVPFSDSNDRKYIIGASMRNEAVQGMIHQAFLSNMINLFWLTAMTIILSFLLSYILVRPLKRLAETANLISRGELNKKTVISGPREIISLGNDIESMRRSISETISGLNRTRKELQEKEERLELALIGANDGVWDWQVSRDAVYFDEQYYRMAGYSPGDYPASFEEWQKRIHPDDLSRVAVRLNEYMSGKADSYDQTFRYKRKDNTYMWIQARGKASEWTETGPKRLIGTHSDVTVLKEAQLELEHEIEEKQALIQELHHRVKNNLNLINSLLSLQADIGSAAQPDEDALESTRNRVFSMAAVHESLYESDNFTMMEINGYCRKLIEHLLLTYKKQNSVEVDLEIENVRMNVDRAIPFGLMLNEIISNSMIHAFRGKERGKISVSLLQQDGFYRLTAADDGIGTDTDLNLDQSGSLGLELIKILNNQLNGSMEIESGNGLTYRISFPE